jgi:Secretion system C-terminal sorting domain
LTGNIFFCDRYNHCIRKISAAGTISTIAGNGTAGFSGDGGPATAALLNVPVGLAINAAGDLFFCESANNRVRKITAAGTISTIGGNGTMGYTGDGGAATAASLSNPAGIGVDLAGNIFIGDNGNNAVRKINSTGTISTVAGTGSAGFSGDGGPATSAQLNMPQGVSVYGGNIYICDVINNRVRMLNIGNIAPYFIGGNNQALTVCVNGLVPLVPINSLLAVLDSDAGQTETWSLLTPPAHGVAVVSYSVTSTGSTLTPVGLTYTPASGYFGTDLFRVIISDGIATDTTSINVTISPYPDAGAISGTDSVCPGNSVFLSETVTGGIWSTSNPSISTVNSSGKATGIAPGYDTVIYTVINSCGIVSAIFPFKIRSYAACHTGVKNILNTNNRLHVYPNPNDGVFKVAVYSDKVEPATIVITDLLGGKIKEFTANTNETTDISLNLPNGLYILTAVTSSDKWVTKICITR